MVKLARVGVVIPARNEAKNITATLLNLINQTIPPTQIIVVNDGSKDNTKELAEWFAKVVDYPIQHENWVAHKNLAKVFNYGFNQLNYSKLDYVMILGSDHLLPFDYIEKVTNRMAQPTENQTHVSVASGSIKNEFANIPRGSGRMIEVNYFKELNYQYPVNWGYESYLILKAWQLQKAVAYYEDIETTTQRQTAITYKPIMFHHYGRAMKALGYTPIHLMLRATIFCKKKPAFALQLIRGYYSAPVPDFYEDELRKFVKQKQYARIKGAVNLDTVRLIKERLLA